METPFLKFYSRDWQADSALRQCSAGARGVWIELLCIMAQNDNGCRGYLCPNGRLTEPLNPSVMQRLTGLLAEEISEGVKELERNGVFSRTDEGVIFSRRMVKESEISRINRENGKKGGSPRLTEPLNRKEEKSDNRKDNPYGISRIQNPESRDQSQNPISEKKKFSAPSVADVKSYCEERKNSVDAEKFCSFYESNGWRVGKNPMKDWRAAVRTWEKNGIGNGGNAPDGCRKGAEPGKYDKVGVTV